MVVSTFFVLKEFEMSKGFAIAMGIISGVSALLIPAIVCMFEFRPGDGIEVLTKSNFGNAMMAGYFSFCSFTFFNLVAKGETNG
jgi:hypothetical protein